MAGQNHSNTYTQGYSKSTVANHQLRTAESDAAFLLPHIKKTDKILDAGCGPGTITTSLAKYASDGKTIGIDVSPDVLAKAKTLASEANIPTNGPGSVLFEPGNVLEKLSYPDDTFDIIYCGQLFGHLLPSPEVPVRALIELRRVLKLGGIICTRDGVGQHFYPPRLDLNRLWVQNLSRGLHKGMPVSDPPGTIMPSLMRQAGFDADGGKVVIGAGTKASSGAEVRWLAGRATGQLQPEDPFRQSWLDAGITEAEIEETLAAIKEWGETEDAWFAALQCEMLAWK